MQSHPCPDQPDSRTVATPSIGIIGLGLMGTAMAARLLAAGLPVLGWDLNDDATARLHSLGGQPACSTADVFGRCQRVLLSLPTLDETAAVLAEATPALKSGLIIADTTTGAPEHSSVLGRRLGLEGITYLDATISGNSQQLQQGDVILMVGGPSEGFRQCVDLFDALGRKTFHVGGWGAGARMKLATNLALGLHRAALAETLVFGAALGLAQEQLLGILKESAAYSRAMDIKGEKMLHREFTPQARLSQHAKDVGLMLATAQTLGATLPLTETHADLLHLAIQMGLGDLDNSAILLALEERCRQVPAS